MASILRDLEKAAQVIAASQTRQSSVLRIQQRRIYVENGVFFIRILMSDCSFAVGRHMEDENYDTT
jgi:hypothetical protein